MELRRRKKEEEKLSTRRKQIEEEKLSTENKIKEVQVNEFEFVTVSLY